MLNAPSGNPLREPFPPHAAFRGAAPTHRPPASQSAQHPKQQLEASVGTDTGATKRPLPPAVQPVRAEPFGPPPAPHARRTSSFAERLQQRAAAQRQAAQGGGSTRLSLLATENPVPAKSKVSSYRRNDEA